MNTPWYVKGLSLLIVAIGLIGMAIPPELPVKGGGLLLTAMGGTILALAYGWHPLATRDLEVP